MSKKHPSHHKQDTPHTSGKTGSAGESKTSPKTTGKIPRKTTAAKRTNWQIIAGVVALVLVVAIAIAWPFINGKSSSALAAEISVSQAYEKYQQGAFFLDVRTVEEWNDYHAPNSTLIPLDQLPERLNEVPKDREIVVVCRSGNRSQEGRDILLRAGFTNVTSMAGGLKAWQAAGYPTVSGP